MLVLLVALTIIVIFGKVFIYILVSLLSRGKPQPPITISFSDLFDVFKGLLHFVLEIFFDKIVRMAHSLHQFFTSLLTKGLPSPKTKCN